jgi:hypothetical protein
MRVERLTHAGVTVGETKVVLISDFLVLETLYDLSVWWLSRTPKGLMLWDVLGVLAEAPGPVSLKKKIFFPFGFFWTPHLNGGK